MNRRPEGVSEPQQPREPEQVRESEQPRQPDQARHPEQPREPEQVRRPEQAREPERAREPEQPREPERPRQPEQVEVSAEAAAPTGEKPEQPSQSRPVNRFGGPDPATFASSDLWEPVVKAPAAPDDWKPTEQHAPSEVSKPSPLFESPHEAAGPEPAAPRQAAASEGATQAVRQVAQPAQRSEAEEPAADADDELVWPEFDTGAPAATVAMKPASRTESGTSEQSNGAGSDDRGGQRDEAHEPA